MFQVSQQQSISTEVSAIIVERVQLLAQSRQPKPATVLVEMNCQQGMRTMRHDKLKYDRYFEDLREAIGDQIVSPDGCHRVDVCVEATSAIMLSPLTSEGICASNPRIGAFEVYLVVDIADVPALPSVTILFSKLQTRRWPNVQRIATKCRTALEPAFKQWDADEDFQAEVQYVGDLHEAKAILKRYRGRVSHALLQEAVSLRDTLQTADDALQIAMGASDLGKLQRALREHKDCASPNVASDAKAKLALMVANAALSEADTIDTASAAGSHDIIDCVLQLELHRVYFHERRARSRRVLHVWRATPGATQ